MVNIDKSKYIRLSEIAKITGIKMKATKFNKIFPEIHLILIKKVYCFTFTGDRSDYINQICNQINIYYYEKNMKNPYMRIDYLYTKYGEVIPTKYPVLFKTFKDFAYSKITAFKGSETGINYMVSSIINSFDRLVKYITHKNKDIDSFTIDDINNIILDKDEKIKYLYYINFYFKYLKENDVISFSENISIRKYNRVAVKKESDFYSLEEWNQFIKIAFDIDRHLVNAINNVIYARLWLFLLLHLCLAWRKSDILSMPGLDNLVGIEKYNLDWFSCNSFTAKDASYIINNTKLMVEQYSVQKTKAEKHFVIPLAFQIPVAIALVVLEKWRRMLKTNTLFDRTKCSNDLLTKYLGQEMKTFSSIKANRSLLSFMDKTASEIGADKYVKLTSYMRSHKTNYYNMSDTTSQYLKASYSDKELNELTVQLYNRGMFGWLYDSIINIVDGTEMNIAENNFIFDIAESNFIFDMQTKTDMIVTLKKNVQANNLEQISKCLQSQNLKKEKVVNELLKLSKEEIREKIIKLADNHLPAKQHNICCTNEKCKYTLKSDCLTCEYSIPTLYTLLSVKSELINLFNEVENYQYYSEYDKIRMIDKLLKLFTIIKESVIAFGLEYVNSIMDFQQLKQNTADAFGILTRKDDDNGK